MSQVEYDKVSEYERLLNSGLLESALLGRILYYQYQSGLKLSGKANEYDDLIELVTRKRNPTSVGTQLSDRVKYDELFAGPTEDEAILVDDLTHVDKGLWFRTDILEADLHRAVARTENAYGNTMIDIGFYLTSQRVELENLRNLPQDEENQQLIAIFEEEIARYTAEHLKIKQRLAVCEQLKNDIWERYNSGKTISKPNTNPNQRQVEKSLETGVSKPQTLRDFWIETLTEEVVTQLEIDGVDYQHQFRGAINILVSKGIGGFQIFMQDPELRKSVRVEYDIMKVLLLELTINQFHQAYFTGKGPKLSYSRLLSLIYPLATGSKYIHPEAFEKFSNYIKANAPFSEDVAIADVFSDESVMSFYLPQAELATNETIKSIQNQEKLSLPELATQVIEKAREIMEIKKIATNINLEFPISPDLASYLISGSARHRHYCEEEGYIQRYSPELARISEAEAVILHYCTKHRKLSRDKAHMSKLVKEIKKQLR